MATEVRAFKNYGYLEDIKIRNKIRTFHKLKKNDGVGWDGARGEIVEVVAGDVLDAPDDLLDSWLAAGLAGIQSELLAAEAKALAETEENTDG